MRGHGAFFLFPLHSRQGELRPLRFLSLWESLEQIEVKLSLFFVMIAVYAEIGTMRTRVVGDRGCVNCYDHCAL
ncbi:hypothetical protein RHGRI_033316 [Rhododendron griersonianum]|uniref:Uncharacterized protein n=1 Tax=Rhododendron griersonianum TaxID=479676 RepID=A0AAV6HX57_9ERIC|nr:hypothetical protein RHGRI_033316 [Rhododendron griersonianum]